MCSFIAVITSCCHAGLYYVCVCMCVCVRVFVQPTTTMPMHMTLLSSVWKAPRLCNTLAQQFSLGLFSSYSSALRLSNQHTHTCKHSLTKHHYVMVLVSTTAASLNVCVIKGYHVSTCSTCSYRWWCF